MSLVIKEDDLLANVTRDALIVHGCNAQGKMNSGFARKLRNKYPDVYTTYKNAEKEHGLKLGYVSSLNYQSKNLTIANGITQLCYGRDPNIVYVDYKAVRSVLDKAVEFSKVYSVPIHIPFIGGGLANGDRDILLKIFEEAFYGANATLWIY